MKGVYHYEKRREKLVGLGSMLYGLTYLMSSFAKINTYL